jgi:hypothetical protein
MIGGDTSRITPPRIDVHKSRPHGISRRSGAAAILKLRRPNATLNPELCTPRARVDAEGRADLPRIRRVKRGKCSAPEISA